MLIIAIALASAATQTITESQAADAYIVGRCMVWASDEQRKTYPDMIAAIDPRLRIMFDDGIKDSATKGIRFDVCRKLMHTIRFNAAKD